MEIALFKYLDILVQKKTKLYYQGVAQYLFCKQSFVNRNT